MRQYQLLFIPTHLRSNFILIGCGMKQTSGEESTFIAVIPKGTTHEFWKSVHAGARDAAGELNINIIWKGPLKEDDREQQIALVENFISNGADNIALAPYSTSCGCDCLPLIPKTPDTT